MLSLLARAIINLSHVSCLHPLALLYRGSTVVKKQTFSVFIFLVLTDVSRLRKAGGVWRGGWGEGGGDGVAGRF